MKLIKFIAAAVLVVSTSLVSGGQAASAVGFKQDLARGCPNWPYCREVEVKEQVSEQPLYIAKCPNWPYCGEIEIVDSNMATRQVKTEVVRKAA